MRTRTVHKLQGRKSRASFHACFLVLKLSYCIYKKNLWSRCCIFQSRLLKRIHTFNSYCNPFIMPSKSHYADSVIKASFLREENRSLFPFLHGLCMAPCLFAFGQKLKDDILKIFQMAATIDQSLHYLVI
jgi:hypothetical protein